MYMYACTYVRMYICTCLYKMNAIQATKFTNTHLHTYIHCRYVCTYVSTYVLTHAHTHAHKDTHVCMYICTTHIHMHKRTHARIHTRTHTQTSHSSHVRSGAGLCPFRGTTKLSPVWSRNWGEEEENRASGNVHMYV